MKGLYLIWMFYLLIAMDSFAQTSEKVYEDESIKCVYTQTQNRFNGSYQSFYSNGQIKSKGNFENNGRVGEWTVWDTTGRVRMQRVYENPFVFERTVPVVPRDSLIELLSAPMYVLEYNEEGFIEYFDLTERMIVWSMRIWRTVLPADNSTLFEKGRFFDLLNEQIFNGAIETYSPEDDRFKKKIKFTDDDFSPYRVIAYKVKEDRIFDCERFVSETRILGLCPVVVNEETQDTLDLYWLYYPDIRKELSEMEIQFSELPDQIKTFEDLFFHRYFYGQIYKRSNPHDREISDYANREEIRKEAIRMEIGAIEKEHDTWIELTK